MATSQSFVDYLCEQSILGGRISRKKVAVLGTVSEHPPYPGAKLYFRIGDEIDDPQLLQRVFQATADALPLPKSKAVKRKPPKAKAP
ncbi:hypothetical protein [Aquabacterium sp.]|uniref:hypothetical protein n=1 Tax=Aquabacterium sp. TaxID=1872578 RepID=UPI0019AB7348|nr:hypothetical protein [Aquabacterium sp.]MBC7700436.1 hypothetical protein [Aquabacterium sp.]